MSIILPFERLLCFLACTGLFRIQRPVEDHPQDAGDVSPNSTGLSLALTMGSRLQHVDAGSLIVGALV